MVKAYQDLYELRRMDQHQDFDYFLVDFEIREAYPEAQAIQ